MRSSKIIHILFILIVVIVVGYYAIPTVKCYFANNELELTKTQMLEDLNYLRDFMKENCIIFNIDNRMSEEEWSNYVDALIDEFKKEPTISGFYDTVKEALECLNDNHTFLLEPQRWSYFKRVYSMINLPEIPNRHQVFFNPKVNAKYEKWNTVLNVDVKTPIINNTKANEIEFKALEDKRIAYLKINSFSGDLISKDKPVIREFFNEIQDYPYLVIDISNNHGGSDRYWRQNIVEPLIAKKTSYDRVILMRDSEYVHKQELNNLYSIDELPNDYNRAKTRFRDSYSLYKKQSTMVYPNDSINYKGKIYLIIGEHTASAANNFAMFGSSTDFATLLGQPTHGDGTMDSYTYLPNSGLVIRFDLGLTLNSNGSVNKEVGVVPDILVNSFDEVLEIIDKDKLNTEHYMNITPFETVNNLNGATLQVKSDTVTPINLTVIFENSTNSNFTYGESFFLEKKIESSWYQVPTIQDYPFFLSIGFELISGYSAEKKVNWKSIYGILDKGEYRIVEDILCSRTTGDNDKYYLTAEFRID